MADDESPIRTGDINSPYYSAVRPEPTRERLEAPHTRVWVQNTHDKQNHIVIDRFNVGHELRPGEKREMDMVDAEIANFQEHRKPNRFYPSNDPNAPERPKPLHPILIEGAPRSTETLHLKK